MLRFNGMRWEDTEAQDPKTDSGSTLSEAEATAQDDARASRKGEDKPADKRERKAPAKGSVKSDPREAKDKQ